MLRIRVGDPFEFAPAMSPIKFYSPMPEFELHILFSHETVFRGLNHFKRQDYSCWLYKMGIWSVPNVFVVLADS